MSMRESDAQAPVRNDFGQGQVWRVDVEIALYDLQVGRDGAQVVVGGGGSQVAETEDLADFSGGQEFFEL